MRPTTGRVKTCCYSPGTHLDVSGVSVESSWKFGKTQGKRGNGPATVATTLFPFAVLVMVNSLPQYCDTWLIFPYCTLQVSVPLREGEGEGKDERGESRERRLTQSPGCSFRTLPRRRILGVPGKSISFLRSGSGSRRKEKGASVGRTVEVGLRVCNRGSGQFSPMGARRKSEMKVDAQLVQ